MKKVRSKEGRLSFPIRKTYKCDGQVFLHLPKLLGGEQRVFFFKEEKSFELTPAKEPDLANLKITDAKFVVHETVLSLGSPPLSRMKPLHIPELEIIPDMTAIKESKGFVNLKTGRFFLDFKIVIKPQHLPFMKNLTEFLDPELLEKFAIEEELPLLVSEIGKLDLGESHKFKSWFSLKLPPEHPLQLGCSGSKSHCKTETHICATVDGSPCPWDEKGNVHICLGDEVHLWWTSSEDSTEVRITPEVGTVEPGTPGHKIVSPTETPVTTYKITAKGDCEVSDTIDVYVHKDGDKWTMIANPMPTYERWEYYAPPWQFSPSIRVVAIEPTCDYGCAIHQPAIVGYIYIGCHGGAVMCNGDWSGIKLPENELCNTRAFFETRLGISKGGVPLRGTWQFTPLIKENFPFTGFAYFILTIVCGRDS